VSTSSVIGLAGRLIDPQDRETYAALVSYVNSLPPGDELIRLLEILGLLSAVGQRIPDAAGELLAELRSQTKAAETYHGQVDTRLAKLPSEIAAGVDPKVIAESMSEIFRQRLRETGLQDTTAHLKLATADLSKLTSELTASLKPAAGEYRGIASALAAETSKLAKTAREVEELNRRLIVQQRSNRWGMQALAALLIFLVGGLAGIVLEKRQTVDALANIGMQIERVQTPAALPIAESPRNHKKQGL
jgi:hypothetical protein